MKEEDLKEENYIFDDEIDEEPYCEHDLIYEEFEKNGDFWVNIICKKCGYWAIEQDFKKYIEKWDE